MTVIGIGAGVLVADGTLIALDRAITGSAVPYIPLTAGAGIVATVAVLATGAIMLSLRAVTARCES